MSKSKIGLYTWSNHIMDECLWLLHLKKTVKYEIGTQAGVTLVVFSFSAISLYVTVDHKTSHKGSFFYIKIYASPESWIEKRLIDVWLLG